MARISAWDESARDLRRAAVTLVVVATHVAVILVMLRSAGHSADVDVVDITLFALPISLEDRPRQPMPVQKPPIPQALGTTPQRTAVARRAATEPSPLPSENDTLGETAATHAGAASEPAPPIDWRAEIDKSAHALEQRDSIESGRRSLAGPKVSASTAAPPKPACPYEKCEPGWDENLGIFKPSLHSKAGRIEQIPYDMTTLSNGTQNANGREVIQWFNNWCYSILVSPDPARRGLRKCVFPLGKTAARGDLFDHMDESQPPPNVP